MPPVIDIHVHIAARERRDCRVSNKMLGLPAFSYMVAADGINPIALEQHFDQTIRDHILAAVQSAPSVNRAVLLAIDGVYSDNGVFQDNESHFIVSNDYVRELAKANHPRVLFGASINPNRGEGPGMKELERCLDPASGPLPVLVKWVPNSQIIDPADKRHDWFYKALANLQLPLLSHTGPEYAVPVPHGKIDYQQLGDPRRLERALDLGTKVIAAHAASRFFPLEKYDYVKDLGEMMNKAEAKKWKLFTDVSAMCVVCRALETINRVLELIPPQRMILGSDYPVPVNDMPLPFMRNTSFERFVNIVAIHNPIEKNYQQLLAMGFPQSIGTKAAEVLPPHASA